MKPLSVTDLVSPAWCELQYWYTLTKFGKKKRTPAMRQGSNVHKVLEEQVHRAIPIDVYTREDAWGLKLWNVIQGLRTLRVIGMTRELEVWAMIDGQVVNGVIDELSYASPAQSPDETSSKTNGAQREDGSFAMQPTIKEYFSQKEAPSVGENGASNEPESSRRTQKIYLTDTKTRGHKSLPSDASLRMTSMQLMLYRKMLTDLATNQVQPEKVFERYRLNPSENFTGALLGQLADLDFNFRENSSNTDYAPFGSGQDCVSELAEHNNLSRLWGLMMREFVKTIPSADAVGEALNVVFRSRNGGEIIGSKSFVYEHQTLDNYLTDEFNWWKGRRDARGVDVEDAFKCRMCEFAEECTWRKTKIDEATQRHRARFNSQ